MITVTACEKVKDYEKEGKKTPIYKVTLSDGRSAQSFGNEFAPGTPESDFTITEGQYGLNIKSNKKNGFGGGGKPQMRAGNESFALAYAKDLGCAHIAQGKDFGAKEVLSVAEVFYQWLETKRK
jgi:hypothetical protein